MALICLAVPIRLGMSIQPSHFLGHLCSSILNEIRRYHLHTRACMMGEYINI